MNELTVCVCGNVMKKEVNTFTHILFNKEITLHNVPHVHCATCGRSAYDNEGNVVKILREAYLNQEYQAYYQ